MYSTALILCNIMYSWSSHQVKFFFPHIVLANFHVSNLSHVVFPMWEALVICLSIFGPPTPKRSLIRWTLLFLIIPVFHSFSIFTYTYIDFVHVSDTKHVTLQSVNCLCVLSFHQYLFPFKWVLFFKAFSSHSKIEQRVQKVPIYPISNFVLHSVWGLSQFTQLEILLSI